MFYKTFLDRWSAVTSYFLKITSLEGAVAQFQKVEIHAAQFFIKVDQTNIVTTFASGEDGLQVVVDEFTPIE